MGGKARGKGATRKKKRSKRRRRWVDNIKMHNTEVVWHGMGCINLTQNRGEWRAVVNTVMNLRVSRNNKKYFKGCGPPL
jgi:hypothetical protein